MVSAKRFKVVRATRLPLLLIAAVGAVVFAGCGGSSSNAAHPTSASSSAENVSMKIAGAKMSKALGYTTADGKGHDTYIPSDLKVKAGDTITVTVSNYDEGPHTFTSPQLGVNATIAPATNADKKIPSKTKFTFTAKQAGKYRWYCALPCDAKADGWAMTPEPDGDTDRTGYMAGYVVAS